MSNRKTTVTIMAAGEGKRMNSSLPKVLHLFRGVPMLIRILREVTIAGADKIIVVTGKYDQIIQETVQTYMPNNHIIFVQQTVPKGTADAIRYTLDYYTADEDVLILNGDMPLITAKLLRDFLQYTCGNNKIMVASLENPTGYGRILFDTNQTCIGIKEEKDCTEEERAISIVNVGIYFFPATILQTFIPKIENHNRQNEYYLTDIIRLCTDANEPIYTYCIDETQRYQIMGVNTPDELEYLELLL